MTGADLVRICALPDCGTTFTVQFPSERKRFCGYSCSAKARPPRTDSTNANWRGGKASHPLYLIYSDLRARCLRPTHKRYADYGGRGITICDRWRDDFWAFVEDMGPRPEGVTKTGRAAWSIDRMDNDGPYSPENCRWATWSQQQTNRRERRDAGRPRTPRGQFA